MILGTCDPGGGFPLYGDAFAEMVNAQEPQLRVQPRNTKGSTENVPLARGGQGRPRARRRRDRDGRRSRNPERRCASSPRCTRRRHVHGSARTALPYDCRLARQAGGARHAGVGITALGRTVLQSLEIPVKEITLEKAADGPGDAAGWARGGALGRWRRLAAFAALAKSGGVSSGRRLMKSGASSPSNPRFRQFTSRKSYPEPGFPSSSVGSWSYVFAKPGLSDEAA
jgi:hypothetical protein